MTSSLPHFSKTQQKPFTNTVDLTKAFYCFFTKDKTHQWHYNVTVKIWRISGILYQYFTSWQTKTQTLKTSAVKKDQIKYLTTYWIIPPVQQCNKKVQVCWRKILHFYILLDKTSCKIVKRILNQTESHKSSVEIYKFFKEEILRPPIQIWVKLNLSVCSINPLSKNLSVSMQYKEIKTIILNCANINEKTIYHKIVITKNVSHEYKISCNIK